MLESKLTPGRRGYVLLLLEGGEQCKKGCLGALTERMETDAGAHKFCGRGGSRVSRKERRVTSEEKKKKGNVIIQGRHRV